MYVVVVRRCVSSNVYASLCGFTASIRTNYHFSKIANWCANYAM
jgi:hypothetical protein